jgi:hypothetical protein
VNECDGSGRGCTNGCLAKAAKGEPSKEPMLLSFELEVARAQCAAGARKITSDSGCVCGVAMALRVCLLVRVVEVQRALDANSY